jgi:hypothetical protein
MERNSHAMSKMSTLRFRTVDLRAMDFPSELEHPSMVEQVEPFITEYQEAFRVANPETKGDIRVQLWSQGWYRIASPGSDFSFKKYRQSEIVGFTTRLRTKAGEPGATTAAGG